MFLSCFRCFDDEPAPEEDDVDEGAGGVEAEWRRRPDAELWSTGADGNDDDDDDAEG